MKVDDDRWLLGPEADKWLQRAMSDARSTLQVATALRKDISAERARRVMEQVELRRRARAKFSHAERMFFTRKSLEQATDEWVARHKALRMREVCAVQSVADLCCGIGGDLVAFAEYSRVTAVDRDPVAALFAGANARVMDVGERVQVVAQDVESIELKAFDAWHIDPDRRPQGQKRTHLTGLEPGEPLLRELLGQNSIAAWKLAPATELPEDLCRESEQEWISRDGECRQLVVWFGQLAKKVGERSATVLARDGRVLRVVRGMPSAIETGSVGRFVFEPDAAILASRLSNVLASEHRLHGLGTAGYLTGDQRNDDGGLAAFEVIEAMPLDRKRLASWLAERGIGQVEVKKRGVEVEPEKLALQLRNSDSDRATVLITPANGTTLAVVARRLASST